MSSAFKIVIRHRAEALDSPTMTICELHDQTTLAEAQAVFRNHFLKYASDDVIVELFHEEVEALH
jgi:hypothetical protein